MKKIIKTLLLIFPFIFCALNIIGCSQSQTPEQQAIADDNAEIDSIVRDIEGNGPSALRRMPESVIKQTAQTFVLGKRYGSISENQMRSMGGTRQATEDALMGTARSEGIR